MNFKKLEIYGNPTLRQGGWNRTGAGNDYIEYGDHSNPTYYNRICTLDYAPQHQPTHITITGIASKELEVSALVLRSDNYIIASLGWQDNGYTFNLGSTYDKLGVMFRFKNGDAIAPNQVSFDIIGGWHDTPHYIHNTSADTITTLPADIYPNDTTATVGLKGNTAQSGTPTPDNPITPQGTGERTGNLFDLNATDTTNGYVANSFLNTNGEERASNYYNISEYIDISGLSNISISGMKPPSSGSSAGFGLYNSNKILIPSSDYAYGDVTSKSFSVSSNVKYIRISYNKNLAEGTMLNEGTTPLPYEPYGIKIPISSANTTTPVYLGKVQTTRKIKKLVFNGSEIWNRAGSTHGYFTNLPSTAKLVGANGIICSHYQPSMSGADGTIRAAQGSIEVLIYDNYTSVADFKSYLAAQYAAGTPVTVWYVLASETTGIVNEPLMKIGDYADTLSGVSIPVTAGGDTLSVGTIVQPNEVTVNYKGWHPVADVHERNNGAWT